MFRNQMSEIKRIDILLNRTREDYATKNELREEGYDINKHGDEIYFMMPNTDQYKKLDHEWNDRINSGQAGY